MTTNTGFVDIVRYVEDHLGFATSYYNEAYLNRRITARLRRTEAESYGEYFDLLRADSQEQTALLDAFSINVTSFFRNPEVWVQLRPVLRTLSEERDQVRIWSAPCSDGREPYSLAMLAIDDSSVDHGRVEITGTDISESALATARAARYETTRTTDVGAELDVLENYERYVERDGSSFQVSDRVRDLVTFERHDLIRDDPPGTFDLVLCRNLFIYIAGEYKEPILETIDASLVEAGYLVVGMTETLPRSFKARYESAGDGARIYRRVA